MTGDPGGDQPAALGRRLTLTPISFDIVIALGQAPDGLRLSNLAQAIGSPVSSVQAVLRVLVANRLAIRDDTSPPQYRLAPDHPGRAPLEQLGLVLPEPAHALAIALRANPAVDVAVVDAAGFVASLSRTGHDDDRGRLTAAMATIETAHRDVPRVELHDSEELVRMLSVSIGFRDRLRRGILLKGRLPHAVLLPSRSPGARSREPIG